MERKILENVTELAVLFGRLTEAGDLNLEKEDSATELLYDKLEDWAEEFEKWYSKEDGEYYEAINAFGISKFREMGWYSPKKERTQEATGRQDSGNGLPHTDEIAANEISGWGCRRERLLMAELESINKKLSVIANFFQ